MILWRLALASILLMFAFPTAAVPQRTTEEIDQSIPLSGGRVIALHCSGQGKFTVLLEPGDGGHRKHMAALQTALSKRYRVCDYDRRNIGGSSAAPLPRKAADLMADAFDTLSAAHVKGPYILFGSSMGGLLVRSYTVSQDVAGFVTSNQPGTANEWIKFAHPLMSPSERVKDIAWMAGDNNEHIDTNDLSRHIDSAKPASIPYIIMVSTERYQCKEAEICGPIYGAYVAASKEAAYAGPLGQFRILDGDHDLYVTHLTKVVAAIDEVAAAALARTE